MLVAITLILITAGLYFIYRATVIKTVNYEIAGIKIPSRYNAITGTIKPIAHYKGTAKLKTFDKLRTGKLGLSDEQVVFAKLRWAIFEQWANSYPKYKGWQEDPAVFRKANDDFKAQLKGRK